LPLFKTALSGFDAALLALGLIPSSAQTQTTRVFVSAQGSDNNTCTSANPCRTFQHAHDTVAAGGETFLTAPASNEKRHRADAALSHNGVNHNPVSQMRRLEGHHPGPTRSDRGARHLYTVV
jgi:hypothetical protein